MKNKKLNKKPKFELLKKIAQYLLPQKKLFFIAGSFLIVSTGLQLLVPFLFKVGIDKYLTNSSSKSIQGITIIALFLAGVVIVKFFAEYGHALISQIAGQKAMLNLRVDLFSHLQKLSMAYFNKHPIGKLITRVTNDIEAVNELFTSVVIAFIRDSLVFTGSLIILFFLNVKLAFIAILLLPFFIIATLIFRKLIRKVYDTIRKNVTKLNIVLTEDLSGIKIIQVFLQEAHRRNFFKKINSDYYDATIKQMMILGFFRPLVDFLTSLSIALIIVFGGLCVINDALTFGVLVAFIMYVQQMFGPVIQISLQFNVVQSAMAALERIFDVLNEKPEIENSKFFKNFENIDTPKGQIVFENVTFSYNSDTEVLKNVSFSIEPGKSIAIVGATGAGKTSIINLVCRFYDPQTGSIKIDGVELREWPLEKLRKTISVVLQDSFIFGRNVLENIGLGNENISNEKIMAAAELVQATDFIKKLPNGFDEMMMERGATLSSGQRQLLCFARALVHDPKILILDEATSNIDPATESLIQKAIEVLMKGRTSIIVAHRLSTIKKVDEIFVMDGGKICERGSHKVLMAKKGIYYNLYLLQFSHTI